MKSNPRFKPITRTFRVFKHSRKCLQYLVKVDWIPTYLLDTFSVNIAGVIRGPFRRHPPSIFKISKGYIKILFRYSNTSSDTDCRVSFASIRTKPMESSCDTPTLQNVVEIMSYLDAFAIDVQYRRIDVLRDVRWMKRRARPMCGRRETKLIV